MVNKEQYDRRSGRPSATTRGIGQSRSADLRSVSRRDFVPAPSEIKDPVYFGLKGAYRFDDPKCPAPGCFGVLYAGADPECCLLESCGSTTGVPSVSGAYLDARAIAIMKLTESLRFIDLVSDGGLTSIGADARLVTGSYKVAQQCPPH